MNWEKLRLEMVLEQLKARGIKNDKILAAFEKVPRHLFVPTEEQSLSYEDFPIPTGSGYQATILAEISNKVISIERYADLSQKAGAIIKSLNYNNVELVVGDGTEGYPAKAPYDAIIVTAGCPKIPPPLIDQLKEGGRLVIPIGDRFMQVLYQVKKKKDKLFETTSIGCRFVPLVGRYGWEG